MLCREVSSTENLNNTDSMWKDAVGFVRADQNLKRSHKLVLVDALVAKVTVIWFTCICISIIITEGYCSDFTHSNQIPVFWNHNCCTFCMVYTFTGLTYFGFYTWCIGLIDSHRLRELRGPAAIVKSKQNVDTNNWSQLAKIVCIVLHYLIKAVYHELIPSYIMQT